MPETAQAEETVETEPKGTEETTPETAAGSGEVPSQETATEPAEPTGPPDWMRDILYGEDDRSQYDTPPQEQPAEEKPLTINFEDTVLDERSQQAIDQLIETRVSQRLKAAEAERTKELNELRQNMTENQRRQAKAAVAETLEHVNRTVYQDTFRNDPTIRGNKQAFEVADAIVQNQVQRAAYLATDHGVYDGLRTIRDPKFARYVMALTKVSMDLDMSDKPVTIEGADVETPTPSSRGSSQKQQKVTKADREAAKMSGQTIEEYLKEKEEAIKLRGSDEFEYGEDED